MYLAARSEEKANDAIERLEKEGLGPNAGEIVWPKFDLTDPTKAKQAAEWVLGREERLDILGNIFTSLSSISRLTKSLCRSK